jgi:hypothetical protein
MSRTDVPREYLAHMHTWLGNWGHPVDEASEMQAFGGRLLTALDRGRSTCSCECGQAFQAGFTESEARIIASAWNSAVVDLGDEIRLMETMHRHPAGRARGVTS